MALGGRDPNAAIRLLGQAGPLDGVELLVLEDGAGDPALVARAADALHHYPGAGALMVAQAPVDRAEVSLEAQRRCGGAHILFMAPDAPPASVGFIAAWRRCVMTNDPAVAFGGLALPDAEGSPERRIRILAHGLARYGEADDRAASAEPCLAPFNLLVRRDLLATAPSLPVVASDDFDAWAGWARAGGLIRHLDNPVSCIPAEAVRTATKAPSSWLAALAGVEGTPHVVRRAALKLMARAGAASSDHA
ncbi:MAG: hypothetical protein NW200_10095 [Hyphomonadaceae bacterium]|nr:hypothetical protein [Hyphomonadaceae bacterium]